MAKKILGLDLGTTSIGWALVNEAQSENEKSTIIKTGVRVIPLSTDESTDFAKGKATSINADRTRHRGARRSLQRYKLRREELLRRLKKANLINDATILSEDGENSTHSLWALRAKSVTEEVSIENVARILLAINKKRGYKSNRKAKGDDEGQAIDGMDVANKLYEDQLTPGQYVFDLLSSDKKNIPDFYRSDLQNEFDKVWIFQKQFYPEILTNDLKEALLGKNKTQSWAICQKPFDIVGIKRTTKGKEQKIETYKWRVQGILEQLDLEQLAIVLQEINGQTNNSSGYLGEISDRSKTLIVDKITVGQYLYQQLKENPHARLKQQVFYRQDYLNEFESIWKTQAKYHAELTDELKKEIRDIVIFYQRRLKSQKGLISICELEGKIVEINGKKKTIGPRVIPKSSPLFQEAKIWQILNNLKFTELATKKEWEVNELDDDLTIRKAMFDVLNIKGKMTGAEVLKAVFSKPKEWELKNYKDLEGNNTNQVLYKTYKNILELSGHENVNFNNKNAVGEAFEGLGINKQILDFDTELEGKAFEQQLSYQLWHLLYSYEGDNSNTGNDKLYQHLVEKFGFKKEYAHALVNVTFQDDYGSLSAKAIKKIMPHLKSGLDYYEACDKANYNHSHSITKEENDKRTLEDVLKLLPKNSLRNPVVEKILNQMVNVINAIIKEYGKPDEVRIELARELKKSASERADMTKAISSATKKHIEIKETLKGFYPFNNGVRITKKDVLKYKLYNELASNGYKTIYTDEYVDLGKLFTKEFDVEHIIPKAVLFDDSFSNKTLAVRSFNSFKSDKTGIDAIAEKYGEDSEGYKRYISVTEKLFKGRAISKAKYTKLLMKGSEIPDGFIERDLRNTQYIAKKAKDMLFDVFRTVTPIAGIVTSKLREDWQLINVMQELNWDKYEQLGLTTYEKNKDGKDIRKIIDWTKRNDHRHHAMDALTVAFTKHNHIQYYNYLNARRDENHKQHTNIFAIEQKETFKNDTGKRLMKPPMPINEFRKEAKKQLESTLISFKAKNKVVTRNNNKTAKQGGSHSKIELTPRGQLHKETVYGNSDFYDTKTEKVGTKFDAEKIKTVAKKAHREALEKRLAQFDNDPKKAFSGKNSPAKNPIYVDEANTIEIPEKIKLVSIAKQFTIRKDISPDNFKDLKTIKKVVDVGVRKVLEKRFSESGNDAKKAFSNIEENPIWLNKEKGISLKRVTITGVSNAEALHTKKDHHGNEILNENGKPIPVDFVSTGNNHHVAIYKDEKGDLQEEIVSFYGAVARVNAEIPIINKNHEKGWEFLFTMKQNEMFIFPANDFDPTEVDLLNSDNYNLISPNLFRVQKMSSTSGYWFRHHLETSVDVKKELNNIAYKSVRSLPWLNGVIKVRINHIGQIVKVGE